VLVDACDAVGQQRALQLLLMPLTEVSQGVAAGREFDWKTAELALHCVRYGGRLGLVTQTFDHSILLSTLALICRLVSSQSSWCMSWATTGLHHLHSASRCRLTAAAAAACAAVFLSSTRHAGALPACHSRPQSQCWSSC
jgi:hypothetical protein